MIPHERSVLAQLTHSRIAKRIGFKEMKVAGKLSDLWNLKAGLALVPPEKNLP